MMKDEETLSAVKQQRDALRVKCAKLAETLERLDASSSDTSLFTGEKGMRLLYKHNRLLEAENHELKSQLSHNERFKREVMTTVEDLKGQIALLTEAILTPEMAGDDANED
ncbi:hypothetical protein DIPPA_31862 [Diplonema papillatum]|nr:hypothetical protein DIPPA_31862 [Diplonema papillatum]